MYWVCGLNLLLNNWVKRSSIQRTRLRQNKFPRKLCACDYCVLKAYSTIEKIYNLTKMISVCMCVHFKKQSFKKIKDRSEPQKYWCCGATCLLHRFAFRLVQSHRSDKKVRYNFNDTCWPVNSCLRAANPIMSAKKAGKLGTWRFFHHLFIPIHNMLYKIKNIQIEF